jgi:hypothetical protein
MFCPLALQGMRPFESCHPTLTTFLASLILGITRITLIKSAHSTFFFDKVQYMSHKLINLTSLAKPSKVLAVQPLFAFGEEGFSVGLLKTCPFGLSSLRQQAVFQQIRSI